MNIREQRWTIHYHIKPIATQLQSLDFKDLKLICFVLAYNFLNLIGSINLIMPIIELLSYFNIGLHFEINKVKATIIKMLSMTENFHKHVQTIISAVFVCTLIVCINM